jgi:hypothetical protein
MIELLKIHALVRMTRVLVWIAHAADDFSRACRRKAGRILDEAMAWCEARADGRAVKGPASSRNHA